MIDSRRLFKHLILVVGLVALAAGVGMAASAPALNIEAESAILVDAQSGQVLFEKDADLLLPPASMAKIMTMLLVMEDVDAGRIKLTDQVTTSAYASMIGGSQVYLKEGEVFTVEELLKAVAIHSANDAAVALAEHVSGNVEVFVDAMNRRAQQLGMKETYYANPDGLPSEAGQPPTLSSARELAIVARELIKHPKILQWSSIQQADFRTEPKSILYNTNKLVGRYAGLDGLKTGHTEEAGWCLTATAKRGDVRLVSVVMRTASEAERQKQTATLLDYGFRNFTRTEVLPEGAEVGTLRVRNGWPGAIKVITDQALAPLVPRGFSEPIIKEVRLEKVSAPLKAGQKVGVVIAKVGDQELARADVVLPRDVDKANFFIIFLRWIKGLVTGLFH